jgi:hypothetical protein
VRALCLTARVSHLWAWEVMSGPRRSDLTMARIKYKGTQNLVNAGFDCKRISEEIQSCDQKTSAKDLAGQLGIQSIHCSWVAFSSRVCDGPLSIHSHLQEWSTAFLANIESLICPIRKEIENCAVLDDFSPAYLCVSVESQYRWYSPRDWCLEQQFVNHFTLGRSSSSP